MGEDCSKSFRPMRSLSNPASIAVWGGRYPDHYSKRWILPVDADNDWGGVHLNGTIASHWFFLLSAGGTNRTSGMAVRRHRPLEGREDRLQGLGTLSPSVVELQERPDGEPAGGRGPLRFRQPRARRDGAGLERGRRQLTWDTGDIT